MLLVRKNQEFFVCEPLKLIKVWRLELFVVLLQRNKFNKVPLWHKLCVRYEGDLVGRVAYSLSKREKIAFIEQ